jgi:dienelactone hydrolase
LTLAAACALLAGCADRGLEARENTAEAIAAAAHMTRTAIPAGAFTLAAWERLEKKGAPVRVYIEGDGLAWITKYEVSPNPTPLNPLALRLAALDTAANVVYLARPCQYERMGTEGACSETYWTDGRTAPEVISAYQKALDHIKGESSGTGFELVGYSGGAAVAVLAAAARNDVTSLRTVAGNLDYAAFTKVHDISPLRASLSPESVAEKIAGIPQMHFTGEKDEIVPADILTSWEDKSGHSPCVHGKIIPGNTHDKGWVAVWPSLLLSLPPACGGRR